MGSWRQCAGAAGELSDGEISPVSSIHTAVAPSRRIEHLGPDDREPHKDD
jgi:hypothetical protein